MFSLCWLRERGISRGRPSARRRTAKALALGFLIATTFLQTGCRSGGFRNGCGLFSSCGFPARATSRIMQPFRKIGGGFGGCKDGCGTAGCDSGYVDYGVPVGGVISSGVPLSTPMVIPPGSTAPSTLSPSVDSPTDLEALPSAAPGAAPTRGGRSSGVRTPSNYESRRPADASSVDPTLSLTSTPSTRRTPDASRPRAESTDIDPSSVLDHLPPLNELEVTGRADKALSSPDAVKTQTAPAADKPSSGPTPATTSAPTHDPSGGRAVGGPEAAPASAVALNVEASAPSPVVDATNGAVGITRFYPVDLKLAGGDVPSTVGLGWLAEKGFRTVLDLRDPSKVDSSLMIEASRWGLRYVSCPIDLTKLDSEQVERFSAELTLDAARPLYFFDDAGRSAGAMWYVRRVLKDKAAWDLARREAESVGLLDASSWKLTKDFVESRVEPKPTAEPARPVAPAPKPPVQAQAVDRQIVAAPAAPPSVAARPSTPVESASSEVWKPFAALLVTGVSFRAAFIGRSAIPTILSRSRASLPAPTPRS